MTSIAPAVLEDHINNSQMLIPKYHVWVVQS